MNRSLMLLWMNLATFLLFFSPLLRAEEEDKAEKESLQQPLMVENMVEMESGVLPPMELPSCQVGCGPETRACSATPSCGMRSSCDRRSCSCTTGGGLFTAVGRGDFADYFNHLYYDCLEFDPSRKRCFSGKNTFRGGTLILERSNPGSVPLVGTAAGDVIRLNANDFDFNFRGGYDFSYTRHQILHHPFWDVESRYFRVDDFNASVPGSQSGSSSFALGVDEDFTQFATPLGLGGSAGSCGASYFSHLDGIELNAKRKLFCGCVNFLVGARFVELDERGAIYCDLGAEAEYSQSRSINDMYGIQIGGEAVILTWRRFSFEGFIKTGVFTNEIVTHLSYSNTTGTQNEAAATAKHTSFLGETGLSCVCRFTPRLAVRGGYQCLWLEGVATAWEQIPGSDVGSGNAAINTDGSPFYHGAQIALDYRW